VVVVVVLVEGCGTGVTGATAGRTGRLGGLVQRG